jgi:hypothetical protein
MTAIPAGHNLPSVLADGRLIRSPGGFVFAMQSGTKRWVPSGAAMNSCGYGSDSIANVSTPSIDLIPTGPPLYGWPCPQPSFPDGTLLQGSDNRLWVTIGHARKWVASGQALSECGHHWGNRNALGDSIMNSLSVFPEVSSCTADGSLLRRQDGSLHAVYSGLIRHIPNLATFEVAGYDGTRITPVGAMGLQTGDPILNALATGRLVTAGGHVYVMDSGAKRWITGPGPFAACGYRWEARGQVSAATLASIPDGPPLQSPPCPVLVFPHGTLLRGSDSAVWVTHGMERRWMTTLGAVTDCGYHPGHVNIVADGVLAGFANAGAVNSCTAEGSLVMTSNGRVWAVRSGLRRWVPSGPTLEANGSWSAVAPISDVRLGEGRPLLDVVANGRLIQSPHVYVYVMQSGIKHWVPSGDVMFACGYGLDAVTYLPYATVAAIPEAPPLTGQPCPTSSFANGTLLQASDGKIWAVQSGQRRWIISPAAFAACGYHPANVDRLADSIIAALPLGPNLSSPPCP